MERMFLSLDRFSILCFKTARTCSATQTTISHNKSNIYLIDLGGAEQVWPFFPLIVLRRRRCRRVLSSTYGDAYMGSQTTTREKTSRTKDKAEQVSDDDTRQETPRIQKERKRSTTLGRRDKEAVGRIGTIEFTYSRFDSKVYTLLYMENYIHVIV
jgi:hypothetical protein